jgi:Fe-S-cluster-containing hydrogenase component 2
VTACPVDAVCRNPDGEVFVCIHCGRCVEYCPQDCLELAVLAEAEEAGR